MGANEQGSRCAPWAARVRLRALAFLFLTALLAGCGQASSVLNAPAPVPADAVIPYVDGSGAIGLSARDGSMRWQSATGRLSLNWPPVVANGTLYSLGTVPHQSGAGVVALSITDGTVRWHTALPVSNASLTVDSNANLTVDGDMVLVTDATSGLYALDAAGGAIRWHVAGHFDGQALASHGVIVVTRTDAVLPHTYVETTCLAAFRARDGAPLWCIPNYSSALGINQSAVYVQDGMNNVGALSPATGHFLWEATAEGALVAINDQMMLVSDLQEVTALDARTGHMLWHAALDFPGKPSGDPRSVLWTQPGAAAVVGVYQSEVLARRSSDGAELWHAIFSGYTPDQLTVEDGVVFAYLAPPPESSTLERLAALDARTGAVYWERDLPDFMYLAEVLPAS